MDESEGEDVETLATASQTSSDAPSPPYKPAPGAPGSVADWVATAVLAAAAGAAAALASGAPTELAPWDTTLKVVVAVACVLAGRRTAWVFVAAAGILAAVASYGTVAALVSMAIAVLAIAGWRQLLPGTHSLATKGSTQYPAASGAQAGLADRVSALARSACCGALACLALRSIWPHVTFMPSVMAACIIALVLVPGVIAANSRARRITVRAVGLVVLAGILLSAIGAIAVLTAKSPLQAGLDAAKSGLLAAEHGDQATAVSDFKQADHDFGSANSDLTWARATEVVPVVSQQVRAIGTAVNIGRSLASAGVETAASANEHDLTASHGVFPVKRLAALVPLFKQDLGVLSSAIGDTGAFSSPWVLGDLQARFRTEESRLERARRDAQLGLTAAEVLPGFLGANGQRTYLVLVENPAESRASGGAVGDYAEVTAVGGRLHLARVGAVETLNHTGLPPAERRLPDIPDYVDRYSAWAPQFNWENVPMSPDFPTVGRVAAYLYPQCGGVPVNGVISIDPVAIAGLLRVLNRPLAWTGHQPITSKNVVEFLAHQEFIAFGHDNPERIQFVEALLRTVWHDLVTTHLPPPTDITKDMRQALRGGDLLMYSSDAATESFFDQIHLAGAMPAVHGDFAAVVTQNIAASKIDWYVRRAIDYDANLDLATKTISATVTVTLRNLAPASGEPADVIGGLRGSGSLPGQSKLWVNLYTPWNLVSATLDGKPVQLASQYEFKRNVFWIDVSTPSLGTSTLVVHLGGHWDGPQQYSLGWYQQPQLQPFDTTTVRQVTVTG